MNNTELERVINILMGCLSEDDCLSVYITFKEGQWQLITSLNQGGNIDYEVICRHEDFYEFIELVLGYSDYVEGEELND